MKSAFRLAAAGCLAFGGPVFAHGDHAGHDGDGGHAARGEFAFGTPGDPAKPARTVEVTMREEGGKMLFSPRRVDISQGEQIRFVLKNAGALEHEFVLGSQEANQAHAAAMAANPGMSHEEPNEISLKSGATGELVWTFTQTGDFDYSCLIPGHREAGMSGVLVVK
ncbi:plastocyanin/azurin family copper-binding protein [Methylocella sp.]|uniref:cupredoxin domain-containing protein n=1 Tax=Methylocella sp. TaxID=1978226 RepID=UPI0037850AC1